MIARSLRHNAFTLIETLAVAVLLSIASATIVASISRDRLPGALPESLIGLVRIADTRARIESLGRRAVLLDLSEHAIEITDAASGDLAARIELPRSVRATLVAHGGLAPGSIRFDQAGRAPDYRIIFERGDAPLTFNVSGITGWITPETSP